MTKKQPGITPPPDKAAQTAAKAAIKAAIEKQLKDWGFARWYRNCWSHFCIETYTAIGWIVEKNWDNLGAAFKENMKPEERLDIGFMNDLIALRISDIYEANFLQQLPTTPANPDQQKMEAKEKVAKNLPGLLADTGFKELQGLENVLCLALFRAGARAAAKELKKHGKVVEVG